MANQQHIRWLLEGVEAWNRRRQVEGFSPDLSDEDIVARLRNSRLTSSEGTILLDYLNLSYANLRGCNFSGASLDRADLSHSILDGSNFSGTVLNSAKLKDAVLVNSCFWGSNLLNADFTDAYLNEVNLARANLPRTDLRQARLVHCKLKGADLSEAELAGVDLTGSRPWQAKLIQLFPGPLWFYSRVSLDDEIASINDILRRVGRLKEKYARKEFLETTLFYFRGESESRDTWTLTPSVMRQTEDAGFSLRNAEGEMLVDLLSRRADDFVEANSALEQMVMAQHHGLPTRLLDITRNPLVALFHASEKSPTAAGRIHVFAVPRFLVKPFNSDTVSVITNFARLRRGEQNLLLGKTKEETIGDTDPAHRTGLQRDEPYALAMNRLYQFIRLERPSFSERIDPRDLFKVFIVEPQQSLERVRAQSGAFLISAFHERFEEAVIRAWNDGIPLYHHYTLTVPSECKKEIQEELATLEITRESMFPGLDEASEAVKDFYRRQII